MCVTIIKIISLCNMPDAVIKKRSFTTVVHDSFILCSGSDMNIPSSCIKRVESYQCSPQVVY